MSLVLCYGARRPDTVSLQSTRIVVCSLSCCRLLGSLALAGDEEAAMIVLQGGLRGVILAMFHCQTKLVSGVGWQEERTEVET